MVSYRAKRFGLKVARKRLPIQMLSKHRLVTELVLNSCYQQTSSIWKEPSSASPTSFNWSTSVAIKSTSIYFAALIHHAPNIHRSQIPTTFQRPSILGHLLPLPCYSHSPSRRTTPLSFFFFSRYGADLYILTRL